MSSAGLESLAFLSHCSANFEPILDCFIANFNPIRTEVLGECVSLVCKPGVFKFRTQLEMGKTYDKKQYQT